MNEPYVFNYDLKKPVAAFNLPDALHEISGISSIDSNQVACIHDEDGIVFLYDLHEKRISTEFDILPEGDYEGIAFAGQTVFVLRSDGTLYRVENYQSSAREIQEIKTGIPAKNNEGLCFDEKNGRLLIACKSKLGVSENNKDLREIYAFGIQKQLLSPEPVFTFNLSEIKEFLGRGSDIPDNYKIQEDLKLKISDIAIHPESGELYVLSAKDHTLLIF